ncbi:MAG: hypothetical protein JWM34_4122 [Ilumatobacteraceae bacterium]|nr:hypothetical protein [Ilumatobacteraceae bacterium]
MIIVVAAIIGIDLVRMSGADLRRLIDLPIRHLWLIWLALGVQVGVLTILSDHVAGWVGDTVHLATYAMAAGFVVINRRVPGIVIMGVGAAMNMTAIVANGGQMPASASAWHTAGRAPTTGFTNSGPVPHPRLQILGDIFAIPKGWPLANVFSIGDIILVLGLMWLLYRGCRHPAGVPEPPRGERSGSRTEPALEARRTRTATPPPIITRPGPAPAEGSYAVQRAIRRRAVR